MKYSLENITYNDNQAIIDQLNLGNKAIIFLYPGDQYELLIVNSNKTYLYLHNDKPYKMWKKTLKYNHIKKLIKLFIKGVIHKDY